MLATHTPIEVRAERAIFSEGFVRGVVLAYNASDMDLGCRRVGRLRFVCRLEVDDVDGFAYCVRIGARVIRPARKPVAYVQQSGIGPWRRHVSSLAYWAAGGCAR